MVAESNELRFKLAGDLWPLQDLRKAGATAWAPTRPLGGWLCTYGHVGPDGGVVPTRDRDGHVFEAARQLGAIDFERYIDRGTWNDTHTPTAVGLPDSLEFHDGTTPLSKAHLKVGFWTTGHLFDRVDPKSWTGLRDGKGEPRGPSEIEFARSDYYWTLAHLLKGTPRPLGLSADGVMALSACRRRIVWARMDHAAVCETPVNPDATLEIYETLSKACVPGKCESCGSCEQLRKSSVGKYQDQAPPTVIPQYADRGKIQRSLGSPVETLLRRGSELRERVLDLLQEEYQLSRKDAAEWLRDYLDRVAEKPEQENQHGRDRNDAAGR